MSRYDITCAELVGLTGASLDRLLDSEVTEVYEQHLVFCADCRVFLGRQRRVHELLGRLERPRLPENLMAELEQSWIP